MESRLSIPNLLKASIPDLNELAQNDGTIRYSVRQGLHVKPLSSGLQQAVSRLQDNTDRRKNAYSAVVAFCTRHNMNFDEALMASGLSGKEVQELAHGKVDLTTQRVHAALSKCVVINKSWFAIQGQIGQGGFGTVHQATHKGVTVALKRNIQPDVPDQESSETVSNKLTRESRILEVASQTTGKGQSNVIQTLGTAEALDGATYLVMEKAPGGDAEKLVEKQRKQGTVQEKFGSRGKQHLTASSKQAQGLSQTQLTRKLLAASARNRALILTVRDWVDALRHLADKRIAHRDVKPGNFVLDEDGVWKMIDFETAGFEDDKFGRTPGTRPFQLTGNENSMGKSPEWLKSEDDAATQGLPFQVGSKDDVFALGVAMYRLLAGGRFPFDGQPLQPDATIPPFTYTDNLKAYVASGTPFSVWHEVHTGVPIPEAWKPLLDGALHAEREQRLPAEELRSLELFMHPALNSLEVREAILNEFRF